MEYFGSFSLYIIYSANLILAIMMFVCKDNYRPNFLVRNAICTFGMLVFCAAITMLVQMQILAQDSFWIYVVISGYCVLWFLTCTEETLPRGIFDIFAGVLLRQSFGTTTTMIAFIFDLTDPNIGYNLAFILLIHILGTMLFYIPSWFWFAKTIKRNREFEPSAEQLMLMIVVVSVLLWYFGGVGLEVRSDDLPEYIRICIIQTIFTMTMLAFFYSMLQQANQMAQKKLEVQINAQKLEHYESLSAVINAVNIKTHDLKHQIRVLGESAVVDQAVIEDLAQTVQEYDTFVQTGNSSLDVVLTEKALLCSINKIDYSFHVDGCCLDFMSLVHLNALFGNAIDNAIEYLLTVPEEKRFLSVSGGIVDGFVKIRFENYLEKEIQFDRNGFPKTTKADANYHGFGTRSIYTIAQEYGGSAAFACEDKAFRVYIIIPK